MAHSGKTSTEIQIDLDISRGALHNTLSLADIRPKGNPQYHNGRPKYYTDTDERKLVRHVRLNPKETYTQVIAACAFPM
jgi:hypothetical protein